ncbi:MAG: META domain-containing protein [Ilumatobacteraceae bacterium]
MSHLLRVAVSVGAAAMASASFAGCGDSSSPTEKSALSGRAFFAVSAEGFELPQGSDLQLAFDGLGVRMSGGCNSGSADYDVQDGVLIVDAMATTEMACEQALMDLDVAVAALLAAKPTVRLVGDDLTIASAGTVLRMKDASVENPDRSLEGTLWIVTSVLQGDTAIGGFDGTNATVKFVDGTAQVFAGCNRGSGPATVGATAIDFGPIGMTRMACPQPQMELEMSVMIVLQGSVTYRIDADQLTLLNGDTGLLLEAAADA